MGSNRPPYVTDEALASFIAAAFREDVGSGDHSTLAAVSATTQCVGTLRIKDDGILAGVELARLIFHTHDPELKLNFLKADGDAILKGDVAFTVSGSARSILGAERLVLNCMQHMSGIATYTRRLSKLIEGTRARLMDTRKTTPNFRIAEKWAVDIGGGVNHRFALYDMIMLKDNHVDMAGGISKALANARQYLATTGLGLRIEIETRTINEVKEVIAAGGADVVMLDNMSPADMRTAVALIAGKYKTEASGGITEATIGEVARCGVDFISVGALTHSVKSLDLSLKLSL